MWRRIRFGACPEWHRIVDPSEPLQSSSGRPNPPPLPNLFIFQGSAFQYPAYWQKGVWRYIGGVGDRSAQAQNQQPKDDGVTRKITCTSPWAGGPDQWNKSYTELRQWIEAGYRRNIAWQGSLTAAIVIIIGLGLWFFSTRASCSQCRHGEPTVTIPLQEFHALKADLDHIMGIGNIE